MWFQTTERTSEWAPAHCWLALSGHDSTADGSSAMVGSPFLVRRSVLFVLDCDPYMQTFKNTHSYHNNVEHAMQVSSMVACYDKFIQSHNKKASVASFYCPSKQGGSFSKILNKSITHVFSLAFKPLAVSLSRYAPVLPVRNPDHKISLYADDSSLLHFWRIFRLYYELAEELACIKFSTLFKITSCYVLILALKCSKTQSPLFKLYIMKILNKLKEDAEIWRTLPVSLFERVNTVKAGSLLFQNVPVCFYS